MGVAALVSDRPLALAYLLACVLPIVQRVLIGFWPCDDAFISLRFAYNLVHHGQLVFNLGDPVFGCTSLLYVMLLGALHALGVPLLSASWAFTLVADVLVCILLVRVASSAGLAPGLVAATPIIWLIHPVIGLSAVNAMETSLALAAYLAFALACQARRPGLALALVAAMVWVRIDAVVAGLVWVYAWWRGGRPRLAPVALAAATLIGASYLALAALTYGTVIPQSVVAKASTGSASALGGATLALSYVASVAGVLPAWFWYVAPHLVLVLGLALIPLRWAKLRPLEQQLALLGSAHAALFIASGRPYAMNFAWYYVPFLTLTLIPALDCLSAVCRTPVSHPRRKVWVAAVVVLCGLAAALAGGAEAGLPAAWAGRYLPRIALEEPQRRGAVLAAVQANAWLMAGVVALAGAWLAWIHLRGRLRLHARNVIALAALILALGSLSLNRERLVQKYERREAAYLDIGSWASANLRPGEWIAAAEIGAIGWAALDRPIFDDHGLVTREALSLSRQQWLERWQPALVVKLSSSGRGALDPASNPDGYIGVQSTYNSLMVRNDLIHRWLASAPVLP